MRRALARHFRECWKPQQQWLQIHRHKHGGLDRDFVESEEFKQLNRIYREQTHYAVRPSDIPAKETSIMLFPGQGSQYIGMGKNLVDNKEAREIYDIASGILGYDLLNVCLTGDGGNLNKTVYSQPAILVTSLAALQIMKEQNPEAISKCISTAGYDVGELGALVLAGSISFIDAVRIAQKRAEFMQKCSETVPSGMMGVVLSHQSRLSYALHVARLYCQRNENPVIADPVCSIAVDMCTHTKIIAGHDACLNFVTQEAKEFGIEKIVRLPVSGAFHTSLMESARKRLAQVLEDITITKPQIPVYSNLTCRRFESEREVRTLIAQQVCERVKWEQIMQTLTPRPKGKEDFSQIYGVGPSRQLGEMLMNTNKRAFRDAFEKIDC